MYNNDTSQAHKIHDAQNKLKALEEQQGSLSKKIEDNRELMLKNDNTLQDARKAAVKNQDSVNERVKSMLNEAYARQKREQDKLKDLESKFDRFKMITERDKDNFDRELDTSAQRWR